MWGIIKTKNLNSINMFKEYVRQLTFMTMNAHMLRNPLYHAHK